MKYIEKDKAYKIVIQHGSYSAATRIADLPSIDLVRCVECEHRFDGDCPLSFDHGAMPDHWFCADGERKEAQHE